MQSGSTSTNSQVFTPFNIYGSYQVNDQIVVGLGIYNPFGLGTQWPSQWGQLIPQLGGMYAGSFLSVNANIATYYFNPTIAYKINDNLSVGLGVSYVYATVDMTKTIPWGLLNPALISFPSGTNELKGTGNGFNADLGVIYKPIDKLSLGLSYRITTKIDFSGNATFSNVPAPLSQGFPGGTGTATLPMPGNLYFGVAYMLCSDLRIEANFQYVQWSAYDKLQINIAPVTPYQGTITYAKKWNDEPILRIGAEYKLNENWTVRAGAIEDLTPQPASVTEPMLPDADLY